MLIVELLDALSLMKRGKVFEPTVMNRARRIGSLERIANPKAFNLPSRPDSESRAKKARKIIDKIKFQRESVVESLKSPNEIAPAGQESRSDLRDRAKSRHARLISVAKKFFDAHKDHDKLVKKGKKKKAEAAKETAEKARRIVGRTGYIWGETQNYRQKNKTKDQKST
jgi:hypothetical protein